MLMLAPLRPLSGATMNTSPNFLAISASWLIPAAATPSSLLINMSFSIFSLFLTTNLRNSSVILVLEKEKSHSSEKKTDFFLSVSEKPLPLHRNSERGGLGRWLQKEIGIWCNWQHNRFWSCYLWFESIYPNTVKASDFLKPFCYFFHPASFFNYQSIGLLKRTPRVWFIAPLGSDMSDPRGAIVFPVTFY